MIHAAEIEIHKCVDRAPMQQAEGLCCCSRCAERFAAHYVMYSPPLTWKVWPVM